jgi:hypothetical protein
MTHEDVTPYTYIPLQVNKFYSAVMQLVAGGKLRALEIM